MNTKHPRSAGPVPPDEPPDEPIPGEQEPEQEDQPTEVTPTHGRALDDPANPLHHLKDK